MCLYLSRRGAAEREAPGKFEHALSNEFLCPFLLAGAVDEWQMEPQESLIPVAPETCKIMSNELIEHILSCFYPLL